VVTVDDPVFAIDASGVDGQVLVSFIGELDMAVAEHAHDQVAALLDQNPHGALVLELGRLTYCDSSGISLLLRLQAETHARDRTMTLRHVHPNVARVFEAAGVSHQFAIEE
jgi:anti-anti-sigma factor